MTITIITVCDQCQNTIDKYIGIWTISFESSGINHIMHFCSFDHMRDYLNYKDESQECQHELENVLAVPREFY